MLNVIHPSTFTHKLMICLFPLLLLGCSSNDKEAETETESDNTLTWQDVSAEYSLPTGVNYFLGSIGESKPLHYVKLDLTNDNLELRAASSEQSQSIMNFAEQEGVLAAINGGFFSGNSSYSALIDDNEFYARNVTALTRSGQSFPVLRSALTLSSSNQASVDWVYQYDLTGAIYGFAEPLSYSLSDTTPQEIPEAAAGTLLDAKMAIGGGPTLVKNGQSKITYDEEIFWGSGVEIGDYRPRSAVCITADNHVIMLVAKSYKISALPELLISLGCDEAMNLDGGGSTALAVGGESIYNQGRSIPTSLLIVDKSKYLK